MQLTDDTENKFIANCFINKLAKQSRDVFLQKLCHIKYIRNQPLKAFSLLPITEEDWIAIERFYTIINKGDFGLEANFPYERPSSKIFGIYVPIDLYRWFSNNNLQTIQKQITLYNAFVYYFLTTNIPENLFNPLFKEIERLVKRYFLNNNQDVYTRLAAASADYCNAQMPLFLSSFDEDVRENIYVHTAYFNYFDWNYFVLNKVTKWYSWAYFNNRVGPKPKPDEEEELIEIPEHHLKNISNDNLKRTEANQETWSKWLMTFHRYPITKSYIYGLFNEESASGYIYVLRSGLSNRYKIGWTADSNIEKRKSSLQTGAAEPLILIEFFPAASRKTEQTIHSTFSKNRLSGEWFELADEELAKLLSSEWRRKNSIF